MVGASTTLRSATDILASRQSRLLNERPALAHGMSVGVAFGAILLMMGTRRKQRILSLAGVGVGSASLVGRIALGGSQGSVGSRTIDPSGLSTNGLGRIWPTNSIQGFFYKMIYGGAVKEDLARLSRSLNKMITDAESLVQQYNDLLAEIRGGENKWAELKEVGEQLEQDYKQIQRLFYYQLPDGRWNELSAVLVKAGGDPLQENGLIILESTLQPIRDFLALRHLQEVAGATCFTELAKEGGLGERGLRAVNAAKDLKVADFHHDLLVFYEGDLNRLATLHHKLRPAMRRVNASDLIAAVAELTDNDRKQLEEELKQRFGTSIYEQKAPMHRSAVTGIVLGDEIGNDTGVYAIVGDDSKEVVLARPNIAALFADQGGLPPDSYLRGELHAEGYLIRERLVKMVDCHDKPGVLEKFKREVEALAKDPRKFPVGNLKELIRVKGSGTNLEILGLTKKAQEVAGKDQQKQKEALIVLESFMHRCLKTEEAFEMMKSTGLANSKLAQTIRLELLSEEPPKYLAKRGTEVDAAVEKAKDSTKVSEISDELVLKCLVEAGAVARIPKGFSDRLEEALSSK